MTIDDEARLDERTRKLIKLMPGPQKPGWKPLVFVACLPVVLTGCFSNPTIEEEIADKCGVSVGDYQTAQVALDSGPLGASRKVGRCTLKQTSEGVTDGTIK